jgi:lipid-binding SYLF domain-containing protein
MLEKRRGVAKCNWRQLGFIVIAGMSIGAAFGLGASALFSDPTVMAAK